MYHKDGFYYVGSQMFSYETSFKLDENGFELTKGNPMVKSIDVHILYYQTQGNSCHDILMLYKRNFQCAIKMVDPLTQPRRHLPHAIGNSLDEFRSKNV